MDEQDDTDASSKRSGHNFANYIWHSRLNQLDIEVIKTFPRRYGAYFRGISKLSMAVKYSKDLCTKPLRRINPKIFIGVDEMASALYLGFYRR